MLTIDTQRQTHPTRATSSLSVEQSDFYCENGYLHVPQVFSAAETDELSEHLDWLIETWAQKDAGWSGPWRQQYMNLDVEKRSMLISLHDLQYYSDAWARAVMKPALVNAVADMLGERNVELHHSTLHVKPPETGHPFPMHQDWAFYKHADERYLDVLVHLDDTCHDNGEIRFLPGSHKAGPLEHVVVGLDGKGCTPHLPTDHYRLADTVAVPARRGDVVCFNIFTVHGSHMNKTARMRRLVRLGYRVPENAQTSGQSKGRPGWMVLGRRRRGENQVPFATT